MKNFVFDPETHSYTLDGRKLPTVTGVLASVGIIDTTFFTEEAAWRGSVLHKCCELDDLGKLDESSVDQSVAGRLQGWRKFKAETGFKATEIEKARYSKTFLYAGTPDRMGRIGKVNVLPDLKSGAHQDWHPIQLAAYAYFFPAPKAFHRVVVVLRDNGNFDLRVYTADTIERHFNIFISALNVWNWRNQN